MTDPLPDVPVIPAATLILMRERPRFEVLMIKRHQGADFAGGALVFPGGKVNAGDADSAWAPLATGWDAVEPEQRAIRLAAVRETFEESGVLLARTAAGGWWNGQPFAPEVRRAVDKGEKPFLEVVREAQGVLDLGALAVLSRWITPPGLNRRFDTWFYLAAAPHDQAAVCDGREAVDAEWIEPAEALRLARDGQRKLMIPTRLNLQEVADAGSVEAALALTAGRPLVTVKPWIEKRPEGLTWCASPETGYGVVELPLNG